VYEHILDGNLELRSTMASRVGLVKAMLENEGMEVGGWEIGS